MNILMCVLALCVLLYVLFNHPHLVSPGYSGQESSSPLSSRLACPTSSRVTGQWGEPCN